VKSLPDRLNDRFEKQNTLWHGKQQSGLFQSSVSRIDDDPDVKELVLLVQRLQTAPQLQVNPDFAQHLEGRILAHHATLLRRGAMRTTRRNGQFLRSFRTQFALGIALVCLLVMGTMGTLTAAAQVTNPSNPLYQIKQWMQDVQRPQATSAVGQAEANWHTAHDQLKTVVSFADSTHVTAYHQALMELDQQINALAQSIKALPAGPDRDNLSDKLVKLKADARQVLRGLLARLT